MKLPQLQDEEDLILKKKGYIKCGTYFINKIKWKTMIKTNLFGNQDYENIV